MPGIASSNAFLVGQGLQPSPHPQGRVISRRVAAGMLRAGLGSPSLRSTRASRRPSHLDVKVGQDATSAVSPLRPPPTPPTNPMAVGPGPVHAEVTDSGIMTTLGTDRPTGLPYLAAGRQQHHLSQSRAPSVASPPSPIAHDGCTMKSAATRRATTRSQGPPARGRPSSGGASVPLPPLSFPGRP